MRVGITVYGNPPADIVPICQHAEQLGFARAWVGDHVVIPIGHGSGYPYNARTPVSESASYQIDVWVMVGQILAATTTLEVATGIAVLALRHPLIQARAAATAAAASGGRFRLGSGVGWLREEYEALGVTWPGRGRRMDEILTVLQLAFAGGAFEFHGEFYDFASLIISPGPVSVPIIMGGSSRPTVERAARRADGFYFGSDPTETTLANHKLIREIRDAEGLNGSFEFTARIIGEPTREEIAPYVDAGIENFIVPWLTYSRDDPSLDGRKRALERIAADFGLS
jgi:probable F420-dependent oxidoreductase